MIDRFDTLQNKKRQIIPTFVDERDSHIELITDHHSKNNLKTTSCCNFSATNTITSHHHQLDTDALTHTAAMAASIAAMNVVNQPFVKIHTEFEEKIAHVINQLDQLKEKNVKESCKVNPNYDEEGLSKLKYLEKVQDNQVSKIKKNIDEYLYNLLAFFHKFQLITELIHAIGKDKPCLNAIDNEFNLSTEPKITNKPNSRVYSKSMSNLKNKPRSKRSTPDAHLPERTRCSRRTSPAKHGNKENLPRNNSSQSGCSTCDYVSRSRSQHGRSRSSDSLKNLSETDSKRSKKKSRSRSGSRGRARKGEFLEELLDSAKSPVRSSIQKKKPAPDSYEAKKDLFNELYPDRPTLFDKYLVIITFY